MVQNIEVLSDKTLNRVVAVMNEDSDDFLEALGQGGQNVYANAVPLI